MTEQLPSDQSDTPKTDAAEIAGYECDRRQGFVPADFARLQERRIAELEEETVHRVCQFLREEVGPRIGIEMNCYKCPVRIETPYCIARAQELIAIVRSGS